MAIILPRPERHQPDVPVVEASREPEHCAAGEPSVRWPHAGHASRAGSAMSHWPAAAVRRTVHPNFTWHEGHLSDRASQRNALHLQRKHPRRLRLADAAEGIQRGHSAAARGRRARHRARGAVVGALAIGRHRRREQGEAQHILRVGQGGLETICNSVRETPLGSFVEVDCA
jgi:hypothetical protein